MDIPESLRTLMFIKKVNAHELSMGIGVSPQTISQWKRGLAFPRPEALERIAIYANVKVSTFISWGEETQNAVK